MTRKHTEGDCPAPQNLRDAFAEEGRKIVARVAVEGWIAEVKRRPLGGSNRPRAYWLQFTSTGRKGGRL